MTQQSSAQVQRDSASLTLACGFHHDAMPARKQVATTGKKGLDRADAAADVADVAADDADVADAGADAGHPQPQTSTYEACAHESFSRAFLGASISQ